MTLGEATEAYQAQLEALRSDPENEELQEMLKEAERHMEDLHRQYKLKRRYDRYWEVV